MADEPKDFEAPLHQPFDIKTMFEEQEDELDWDALKTEPSKVTREKMLLCLANFRRFQDRRLAGQSVGWNTEKVARWSHDYPPFRAVLHAISDEIGGIIRSRLVNAAIEGESIPALMALDRVYSPQDYAKPERAPQEAPTVRLSVSTILALPPAPTTPAIAEQVAKQGVTEVEVPFTLPGGDETPRPRWYTEPGLESTRYLDEDEFEDEDEDEDDE